MLGSISVPRESKRMSSIKGVGYTEKYVKAKLCCDGILKKEKGGGGKSS